MIEIDEVICVASPDRGLVKAWCSDCGAEVLMLTPQQAAAITQVSVREVNRSIEARRVHFLETPDRQLLVCLNSLMTMRSPGLLEGGRD